jgi:hypothetical protein
MANILATWTSFYANHAVVRTLVVFFHIGGLVIAGGCAISTDRAILRVSRRPIAERTGQLIALHGTHLTVMFGLVVVIGSGLLLLGADTDTMLHSTLFWSKMALVVALLLNGFLLTRAGYQAQSRISAGWRTLQITSVISVALCMLITLAGAALPNVS